MFAPTGNGGDTVETVQPAVGETDEAARMSRLGGLSACHAGRTLPIFGMGRA
jgi:hypothetical protein